MKTAFKTILVLMLCFCLTVPALSEGTGSAPVLIFEDSFNGEALDRSKWAPCPNWVRQDGLSVWDSKLIRLNGQGQLVLRAEWDEKARRVRAGAVRGRAVRLTERRRAVAAILRRGHTVEEDACEHAGPGTDFQYRFSPERVDNPFSNIKVREEMLPQGLLWSNFHAAKITTFVNIC